MRELIGKTLGKYKIVEEIGHGGMATVYKGYQPSLNRYVAVKVLARELAKDEVFRKRFKREAEAVAKLSHPNIVPIYDFDEEPSLEALYIVTELVEGSLKERLGRPMEKEEAIRIAAEVARALDYAHRQGIVHRDVKPSNILLAKDGRAMLTDFGIAKMVAGTQYTETGRSIGTPTYMSPEQAKGQRIDGRSDIYSLGIVLYEMLTGRPPFIADTPISVLHKQVYEKPFPPRRFNPKIPRNLERIILKALAKERERRFRTAGDMARALEEAITPRIPFPSISRPKAVTLKYPPEEAPTIAAPLPKKGTPVGRLAKATIVGTIRLGKGVGTLLLHLALWILKTTATLIFLAAILAIVLTLASSFGLSFLSERAIKGIDWNLDYLVPGKNIIREADTEEAVNTFIHPYTLDAVTEVDIDFIPPNIIEVSGMIRGKRVTIECSLEKKKGEEVVLRLERLNGYPLYIVGGIVSRGINRGLNSILEEAPAEIEEIWVEEEEIVIMAAGGLAPTPTPTSIITPISTPTPLVEFGFFYTVQEGDTIAKIARRYGTSVEAIVEANDLADPKVIRIGQRIFVPQVIPPPKLEELHYDDGSLEVRTKSNPGAVASVKFNVPSISQLLKLKFYFLEEGREEVRIHVLDEDFNSITSLDAKPSPGWFEVDLSEEGVFVEGDFYIGLEWKSLEGPWLGVDTDPPHHKESRLGTIVDRGEPKPDADYLIRAVVLRRR
jgi:serine/threonine-protein kinase